MQRVNRICFVATIAGSSALVFSAPAVAHGADDAASTAGDETPSETASGGKTVYVNGAGPELSIPGDGGEHLLQPWLGADCSL